VGYCVLWSTVLYQANDACGRTLRVTCRKQVGGGRPAYFLEIAAAGNVQTIAALSGEDALKLGRALVLAVDAPIHL